jgi:hypothetical protein
MTLSAALRDSRPQTSKPAGRLAGRAIPLHYCRMRRRGWFRPLGMLLTLWFPMVTGEPGLLHPCPMHGAAARVVAVAHHVHGAATSSAHVHGATQASTNATDHSLPGHDHHSCTCISCCSASAALRAPVPAAVAVAVIEYGVARAILSVESLPRPAPEFSRPFTTGPPLA